MTSSEIRQKYLEFFKKENHTDIGSASLVPNNDPTTLFTGSGMQPLIPYLLGKDHPSGKRLVNSQKSFRSMDIEEVGDNRHTTFFEMLGNWSLGDYFKEKQLPYFYKFLTEEVSIPKERLWVTCFAGDEKFGLPKDTESAEIWKSLGIPEDRIRFYDAKKNWWSRSGTPDKMPAGEPGGADSEVFYEFTQVEHDKKFGDECHPNCDCGRFMEIGNSVFMEYVKQADGSFGKLPKRNVDFGGGLERITAAKANDPDIFKIDLFNKVKEEIEKASGKKYGENEKDTKSFRIVMDHMRASVFLIKDDVMPSNTDKGYILRKLVRRARYYYDILGADNKTLAIFAHYVASAYKNTSYGLIEEQENIAKIITAEENTFISNLMFGKKFLDKIIKTEGKISSGNAFLLYSTYGFPFELIQDIAQQNKIPLDESGFQEKKRGHQELSRKGAEQKFKGGLADTSEMSVKYHTATHLLHKALREVLGEHVYQKGSNITPERLRFDFSHNQKMSKEEIQKVETLVNEKIKEALPVTFEDLPLEEAKKKGAIGLFEEKYGDKVRVYKVGDFSLEFCGGPHVTNTSELGVFKIDKEEAVSAGIRRIKATLN